LLLGRSVLAHEPKPDDRSEPRKKVAAVFDALGLAADKSCRWVAVETGPEGWKWKVEGWMKEEKADEATILDDGGESVTLRRPRPGERRPEVAKDQKLTLEEAYSTKYRAAWVIKPADFAAHCEEFLKPKAPKENGGTPGVYAFMVERGEAEKFVINACRYSYWARQTGHETLAIRLHAAASDAHEKYKGRYIAERKGALHEFVADKIASGYRSGAIGSAQRGAPRAEVLKTWHTIAKIPYHRYREEAQEMVRGYVTLIAEDKKWKEPDLKAIAKLTVAENVAYWMYHLRDANVGQFTDPGMCYVLSNLGRLEIDRDEKTGKLKRREPPPNPAMELKKLGWDALPEVIAHLDDTRPTRCQGHWRSYAPESYVLLRYGDCCQQIFEAITGHSIYDRAHTNAYPIAGGEGKQCKERAEQWYREFKKKGEKQVLIEGTRKATVDSPRHAQKLVEKFPDIALEPIALGARASHKASVRQELVRSAGKLKDEGVVPFLREELNGPFLNSRVAAARALCERGNEEGVQSLCKEWRNGIWKVDYFSDERSAVEEVISLLAASGDPDAITALAADFRAKPDMIRARIAESFKDPEKDFRGRPLSPAVRTAIEDLLAGALTDVETQEPAVGDLAAAALASLWKEPELFRGDARFGERERMRLAVKNAWLKRRGERPVPLPPRRTVTPDPGATVDPLLAAVRTAETAEERRVPLRSLEEVGLPALPAVRKQLSALKDEHPARADLEGLAKRLAMTVAEVRFAGNKAGPSVEVRKRVEALRGNAIDGLALLDTLRWLAGHQTAGVRGFLLTLERSGDDTGAVLTVLLVADRPAKPHNSKGYSLFRAIILDGRDVERPNGAAEFDEDPSIPGFGWGKFLDNLRAILPARPEQYLLVRAGYEETRD